MTGKTNPFPAFEYALLGFLYEGPCHGYEMHKRVTDPDGIGMVWGVKIANLYAQLAKLEKEGLISGRKKTADTRPTRMEYSLTPKGKAAFVDWLYLIVNHPRDIRQEFMVRLFFLNKIQPERTREIIGTQLEVCRTWMDQLDHPDTHEPTEYFHNMVMLFRRLQVEAMVNWLTWLYEKPTISSFKGEK